MFLVPCFGPLTIQNVICICNSSRATDKKVLPAIKEMLLFANENYFQNKSRAIKVVCLFDCLFVRSGDQVLKSGLIS